MNIQECDLLNILYGEPFRSQRVLSEISGHSLGSVNRSLKNLISKGYINEQCQLTAKAYKEFERKSPQNAVILAAGFGMRMVPINMERPKALLEVKGERLIERIIKQLHEIGISDISVIVGFMKEELEYLIDDYSVDIIVNSEFSTRNNLHSLCLAIDKISNTYIIPCDIWCHTNPFRRQELYSWYMLSDSTDCESKVRMNRKREIVPVSKTMLGNTMVGICYLLEQEAEAVRNSLLSMSKDNAHNSSFWEEALYKYNHCNKKSKMLIPARLISSTEVKEINTYEQLRDLDSDSFTIKSKAIATIAKTLRVSEHEIKNISILKKGMTNRSFLFSCKEKKYIMRIPGEGTDKLINRDHETAVYHAISGKEICDDPVYINPTNGYKITRYLEKIRPCDPFNIDDLKVCMKKLRGFHNMNISVDHYFDIFEQIEFYERAWNGFPSAYKDYAMTKKNVFSLREYIDANIERRTLTHIDAVYDNFLFHIVKGKEELQLTDWEYAGMQDPHVDLAMFSIYAFYNKEQIDRLLFIYFKGDCPDSIRIKIYCYIAACGLLWSNWCEFKRSLGVEFGEYSLKQYRYAKDYYKIAIEEIYKLKSLKYLEEEI